MIETIFPIKLQSYNRWEGYKQGRSRIPLKQRKQVGKKLGQI
jgi:hypothetical protein